MVKTDHILFVAAGASTSPSLLISSPNFKGGFPIRVELKSLTEADFVRIMTEPENALTKQYAALVAADVRLSSSRGWNRRDRKDRRDDQFAHGEHRRSRLHTVMTTQLEDTCSSSRRRQKRIVVDAVAVREKLKAIVEDEDLRKYIL